MSTFIFADNIKTTLSNTLSSSATTMTVASTTNMPAISAGQILVLSLNDAATGLIYEIVYATARTGATLTIMRGQEGTAAVAWAVGDTVYGAVTAGELTTFVQSSGANFVELNPGTPQSGGIDITGVVYGGAANFQAAGTGTNGSQLILVDTTGGDPTPNKGLRVDSSGRFGIINSAETAQILTLTDGGNLTVVGNVSVEGTTAVASGAAAINLGAGTEMAFDIASSAGAWEWRNNGSTVQASLSAAGAFFSALVSGVTVQTSTAGANMTGSTVSANTVIASTIEGVTVQTSTAGANMTGATVSANTVIASTIETPSFGAIITGSAVTAATVTAGEFIGSGAGLSAGTVPLAALTPQPVTSITAGTGGILVSASTGAVTISNGGGAIGTTFTVPVYSAGSPTVNAQLPFTLGTGNWNLSATFRGGSTGGNATMVGSGGTWANYDQTAGNSVALQFMQIVGTATSGQQPEVTVTMTGGYNETITVVLTVSRIS